MCTNTHTLGRTKNQLIHPVLNVFSHIQQQTRSRHIKSSIGGINSTVENFDMVYSFAGFKSMQQGNCMIL